MAYVVAALHGQLASIFGVALDAWLIDLVLIDGPDRDECARRGACELSPRRMQRDMGNVVIGQTMSLDGLIAGPNDGPGNPLGDGGGRLFEWMMAGSERIGPDDRFRPVAASRAFMREMFDCGAIVTGRRTFDLAKGWGGHHPTGAPFFLLTHEPPEQHVGPGTDGTVVTDGIESALEQARAVAGEKKIAVGAADVAQQYLRAGLVDEVHISLVPILLGGGVAMFAKLDARHTRLECTRVIESEGVTHLSYRVVR